MLNENTFSVEVVRFSRVTLIEKIEPPIQLVTIIDAPRADLFWFRHPAVIYKLVERGGRNADITRRFDAI